MQQQQQQRGWQRHSCCNRQKVTEPTADLRRRPRPPFLALPFAQILCSFSLSVLSFSLPSS